MPLKQSGGDKYDTDTNIKASSVEEPIKLDDVLRNELGEFGRFQFRCMLLVALPILLAALKNDFVFLAVATPHRCQIPECGESSKLHTYNPDWIVNAVPETSSGLKSCSRYAPYAAGINGSLDYCPVGLFDQGSTIDCDGFVYANDNSIVYDFDLGCQEWLRALAGTVSSLGVLLGLPLSGYISDRFGRKIALVFNIFSLAFVGMVKAFSVNYTMFMILQIIQTVLGSSVYASAYLLVTEFVGQKYRVAASASAASMYSIGQVLLGGIYWLIGNWRYTTLAIYVPGLFLIVCYWFLPESIRWLLSKKKYDEARKILETVARVNKRTISEKTMKALLNPPQAPIRHLEGSKPGLIRTILRSPVLLRRVCTTPFWWIAMIFVFYGLSINSTGLSETIYLNYMLACAVELPGFCAGFLLLDRIGRRGTLSSGFFFSSICNILFIIIPRGMSTFRLITYLLGKFGIAMAMTSVYLYTSELYPTEFRHTLLAFSSMIGRIGSIVAPLTPVFIQYWHGLPSAMFGAVGFLGGVLVLTQPETLGTKMPDTLAEAEMLGKPKSKLKSGPC
ncbi:organic cation transporter protein-like [Maniola jurtina]|uniref:organic cation transporter protein-like n=1 Tax=Maniola jurtina TaxID=191418 RepID=UPI001E68BA65|nr:organic cation transporter protein-like [Maniola jurtina]